jgi:esterase/lipase superfamily enzyme
MAKAGQELVMSISVVPFVMSCVVLAAAPLVMASEPIVHQFSSTRQSAMTSVQVLLPDRLPEVGEPQLLVVYVLPVEAGHGTRWGDSLAEVQKHDLHNKHHVAGVFPKFADLPWYADHPENTQLQQEAYLLQDVVPLVEQNHPVLRTREGRLLVGFSKSGWGAWSLLLRHPDVFHRAAAFDAPMMMDAPGKYGSGPIFGTAENFGRYQISSLLQQRAADLRKESSRLMLIGQGNFQKEHVQIKDQMEAVQIPHTWIEGSVREHSWNSGWLPEAFEFLSKVSP